MVQYFTTSDRFLLDTRSGAVNGVRSDQSNITLDRVDVNDQSNGYAFTSLLPTTIDSVQEEAGCRGWRSLRNSQTRAGLAVRSHSQWPTG